MDTSSLHTIKLAIGATHCIEQAEGLVVRALRGRIWLTVAGMLDDVVLDAGEAFEVPSDELVVIEPMEVGGNDGSAVFETGTASQMHGNARIMTFSANGHPAVLDPSMSR